MLNNKRGVMGLDTTKKFVLGILIIAIIGVIAVIVLFSLFSATNNIYPLTSYTSANNTYTSAALTAGTYLNTLSTYSPDMTCTIYDVRNATGTAYPINSGNYTQTNCYVINNLATDLSRLKTISWNISYTYTTRSDYIASVITNTTKATTSFYGSVTIWFLLVGIVVIILIMTVVLVVVNKFGKERGEAEGL